MASDAIVLTFYGRMADQNELDVYDAGRSITGLARTISILGHYYETGKIISQAPSSVSDVRIRAPRQGSWWVEVLIGTAGSVLAVPAGYFITKAMDSWNPNTPAKVAARETALRHKIEVQAVQLESKKREVSILEDALEYKKFNEALERELNAFKAAHHKELDVVRSVVSGSYKEIFRPIGRSADYSLIHGRTPGSYGGVMDQSSVAMLDTESQDDDVSDVQAVVNGFSRSSKTGIAFSDEMGRGFRFHFGDLGPLNREDDFSWSQFTGKPVTMTGRFVYFHDGTIKRLNVYGVSR